MINKTIWIKIDEAIKVIEKAADKKLINHKTAETIIQDLYHETNTDKYHRPEEGSK